MVPSQAVESDPEIGQFSSQSPASSVGPIDSFSESQSILRNVSISVPNSNVPNSSVEMSEVDDNSVADNLNVNVSDNNEVILIDSGDLVGSKTPVTYVKGDESKDNCNDDSLPSIDNDNENVEASAPNDSMELRASGPPKPRARPWDGGDSGGFLSKIPRFGTRKSVSKNPKPNPKTRSQI